MVERKGTSMRKAIKFYTKHNNRKDVIGVFCKNALLQSIMDDHKSKFDPSVHDKINWEIRKCNQTLLTQGNYCYNHHKFYRTQTKTHDDCESVQSKNPWLRICDTIKEDEDEKNQKKES